jgi:ubiquinone biosynthesis protein UbiJ
MSASESDQLTDKITAGVKLAINRLIERTKKKDGELVIGVNGKVVRVKARDLKSQE